MSEGSEESRHYRSVRIRKEKAQHEEIVHKLQLPIEQEFELALENVRPPCVTAGLPSRWTDWSSDPELAEDTETIGMPTRDEARAMCAGCPLLDDRLCERYAVTTGQSHGVWGSRRREGGRWV